MRIYVISIKGTQPPIPIETDFDERGGTIGRDASCSLVLSDPERTVSRLQATIRHESRHFVLIDQGSNPTLVNGRPVGKGVSLELHAGDHITIGQYELEVASDDQATVAAVSNPLGMPPPVQMPLDDPFAQFAKSSSPVDQGSSYQDDDPFAVFFSPANPPSPKAGPSTESLSGPDSELGQPSIDSLFGLDTKPGTLFSGTPLSESPSAAHDPMALFGAAPTVQHPNPVRDDVPMLRQAFTPPIPRKQEVGAVPGRPAPNEMVFSWENPSPRSTDFPIATPNPTDSQRNDAAGMMATPQPYTRRESPPPATSRSTSSESMPPQNRDFATSGDALLDAFLDGLGVQLDLGKLTPELMRKIGIMLRESTQGTIDLMQARAMIKREVRAEVTMIVSKGNNPLKFSPDLAFALMQLLTGRSRGFMRAEEAMRDAYDDLRAHQFGFMAGMRAALAGVLQRFTPEEIEQRVAGRGLLDNLVPGSRKARMWDLFEAKYAEISREASDDFQALFGNEFLRAYDEQVKRLREDRANKDLPIPDTDRNSHA